MTQAYEVVVDGASSLGYDVSANHYATDGGGNATGGGSVSFNNPTNGPETLLISVSMQGKPISGAFGPLRFVLLEKAGLDDANYNNNVEIINVTADCDPEL